MALDQYHIPWEPPDITSGVATLLTALKQRRENRNQDELLQLKRDEVANAERRASAEEARKAAEFKGLQRDKQAQAAESAVQYDLKGDHGTAAMLRAKYKIGVNPETAYFTPATALAPKAGSEPPVALEPSTPSAAAPAPTTPVTPLNVFAPQETHTGTTVPEQQPQMPPVEPPTVIAQPPGMTGRAAEDLLPMNEEKPTGRLNFTDEAGASMGYFDPNEQQDFNTKRAEAIRGLLEHPTQVAIAEAVAQGYIPLAEGKTMMQTLSSEGVANEKAKAKVAAREDQQTFIREENAKYKNEGMTVQDRKDIAEILARAKMAASGAGPITPDIAAAVRAKQEGASDADVMDMIAASKADIKKAAPLIQNVVKNATAGERALQKREGLVATDAKGNVIGDWKNPTVAAKGAQMVPRFHRVEERLQSLINHVRQYGERIDPDTQQYKDRISLAESAAAALRPYNELSSTDASMTAERAILGPTGAFGHGWMLGANLHGLERIYAEAQGQYKAQLGAMLKPAGSSRLAPSLGGSKPTAPDAAHPDLTLKNGRHATWNATANRYEYAD